MLNHISHPDIDKAAYDRCVKASENFRIYALSWYLDATGVPAIWPWGYQAFADAMSAPVLDEFYYEPIHQEA